MNNRKRLAAKKGKKRLSLLILLLVVSIGFALLSVTLKINGTASIKSSTWDIHWENVVPNTQSTVTAETPTIGDNRTNVSYEVELEMPGDFYEFTVDAKNDGSVNGIISEIQHTVKLITIENEQEVETTATLPSYILYSVYYDGTTTPPNEGDILEAGDSQRYRVRIEYDRESTTLPETNLRYRITDEFTYTQTKEKPVKVLACKQLENDLVEDTGATGLVGISHNATANTVQLTDYRYMGANPNNYIKFNCTDPTDVTSCETWRIIGCTSEGNVKIIRDESIVEGMKYRESTWDENLSHSDWATSDIKAYLNGTYYNSLSADAKNLIEEKTWYTSGYQTRPIGKAEELYQAERSNNSITTATTTAPTANTVTAKVGLMYASDYGYASSACHNTHDLDYEASTSYKDSSCKNSNWLNKGYEEWTMTPVYQEEIDGGFTASDLVSIRAYDRAARAMISYGWNKVRPVVYLKPNAIVNGAGSSADPYTVGLTGWYFENEKTWNAQTDEMKDQKWIYYENGERKKNGTFVANGAYRHDGVSNHTYLAKDGYIYFGWYQDKSGNRYFFSWFDKNNNGYVEGHRLENTTQTIDGVSYTFGDNGVCTQNCEQAQNVLVEE